MKKIITYVLGLAIIVPLLAQAVTTPVTGKLIALDAGHGGTESGAVNTLTGVKEKDVNLAVVYDLKTKLEANGATVVLTRDGDETITSRKDRVQIAMDKCLAVLARKCDILVSVHHNGSSDPTHDGTLTIYNEKQDIPLAKALHDTLLPLTGQDEGYLNGGFGITVYNHLVSALTEAYYITNDSEAQQYLLGTTYSTPSGYSVFIGARTDQETQAQYDGISNYFLNNSGGKGGKPR